MIGSGSHKDDWILQLLADRATEGLEGSEAVVPPVPGFAASQQGSGPDHHGHRQRTERICLGDRLCSNGQGHQASSLRESNLEAV